MKHGDHSYTNPEWSIQELKYTHNLKRFILALFFTFIAFVITHYLPIRNAPFFLIIIHISIIILVLLILYSFYMLIINNRNFILYDIFYTQVLKIKIVTIDENLSPFTPITKELEKIVIGKNSKSNNITNYEKQPLKDKISFFWIRKNRKDGFDDDERERRFKPFLSLIVILFALKEKTFKLVSVVGAYFTIVGIVFISLLILCMEKITDIYKLSDSTVAIILISTLVSWYLVTTYSALKMVSIDTYVRIINSEIRRLYLRDRVKLGTSYQQIINEFEKESAVYIYDYQIDKYQLIDKRYLHKNLSKGRKLVKRSIGTLLTLILSVVFFVFLEVSVNKVFTQTVKIYKEPIAKISKGTKDE